MTTQAKLAQGSMLVIGMKRKFDPVPKDKKSGLPKKYVKGSKDPEATRKEIIRTRALYKMGKLTPAMMDKISKQRSKR